MTNKGKIQSLMHKEEDFSLVICEQLDYIFPAVNLFLLTKKDVKYLLSNETKAW